MLAFFLATWRQPKDEGHGVVPHNVQYLTGLKAPVYTNGVRGNPENLGAWGRAPYKAQKGESPFWLSKKKLSLVDGNAVSNFSG